MLIDFLNKLRKESANSAYTKAFPVCTVLCSESYKYFPPESDSTIKKSEVLRVQNPYNVIKSALCGNDPILTKVGCYLFDAGMNTVAIMNGTGSRSCFDESFAIGQTGSPNILESIVSDIARALKISSNNLTLPSGSNAGSNTGHIPTGHGSAYSGRCPPKRNDPKYAQYYKIIDEAATKYSVDSHFIACIIMQESGFNPNATSPVGAMGMMQLMPGTAAELGVKNAYDARQNIMGGTKYISQQLNRFGSKELALAAYNAGAGNVQKYGGIPPFVETRNYVKSIMNMYKRCPR